MATYPQLLSGTLAQWPLTKRRVRRQAGVETACGAWYPLFDGAAGEVEWRLSYGSLTRAEAERLQEFHAAMAGRRGRFTFVDPLANLLRWSEDLSQAEWQWGNEWQAEQSAAQGGIDGAVFSGGSQLRQAVPAPGEYRYCFSVWAAGEEGARIRMRCGSVERAFRLGGAWRRCFATGVGDALLSRTECALAVEGGAGRIRGLQLEAQPAPGDYKRSSGGGAVYANSRFAESGLRVVAIGPECYAAGVRIVSPVVE
jgi:hypothetical protein